MENPKIEAIPLTITPELCDEYDFNMNNSCPIAQLAREAGLKDVCVGTSFLTTNGSRSIYKIVPAFMSEDYERILKTREPMEIALIKVNKR